MPKAPRRVRWQDVTVEGASPGRGPALRDLLYQELEHRFRSARAFACELSIVHVAVFSGFDDGFSVRLRLKNVGKAAIKSPVVTIRLLRHMFVRHKQDEARPSNGVLGQIYTLPDPYAMFEKREDIFEPNGRVALKEFAAAAVLLPDHSWTFDGFWFDSVCVVAELRSTSNTVLVRKTC